jgi:hypothetical protein
VATAAATAAEVRGVVSGSVVSGSVVSGGAATATVCLAACLAGSGDFLAFFGRALGGCLCHTRADTKMSSFSAKGAIRHQVLGSAMYRSCELTSSGNLLLSMTGRVVSQVRTPGGST